MATKVWDITHRLTRDNCCVHSILFPNPRQSSRPGFLGALALLPDLALTTSLYKSHNFHQQ